jgi:two-component system response regulator HydG
MPLLVVDENADFSNAFCGVSSSLGFESNQASSTAAAREILKTKRTAVLLLDVTRPESGARSLLEEVKVRYPETVVIAMSSEATIASAVETMRIGAFDYLSKPFPLHILTESLERAAKRHYFDVERLKLQENLPPESRIGDILGKSVEMEKLYSILSKVADSKHPVMILGEDGTGKSLVAKAIHANGPHAAKPFATLDCKTLGPALLEIELFGCAEGAFNMDSEKLGLLTSSQGGTVFLDEIEDMPLELQGKLIKAFKEKTIRAIGGTRVMPLTVRILAATSYDLTKMIRAGRFRLDLLEFLSVVNLRIPPLRGRLDDITFLAKRFLEKIHRETGKKHTLSVETLRLLETYDWPDNVRELEQSIARACSQSSGAELQKIHLPQKLLAFHREKESELTRNLASQVTAKKAAVVESIVSIAKMEERAILEAIQHTGGDKRKAAEMLGIGKTTLYRKLKEYGLDDTLEWAASSPPADSASDVSGTKAAVNYP